jgi:lysine decarboxylase
MQPAYIYPELIGEYGISGEVTPQEVERAIAENPGAGSIILPSPNYYGICSDIKAIAEVAHRHGKILIVDQAHGAHLKWLNGPECAEAAGADITINSIHKTLGSFTQSAVLNLNSKLVDRYLLEDKLQAIQSTSPSYLLMTSLDINAKLLDEHQESLIDDWNRNLDFAYAELAKIPDLRVISGLDNLDRSKINLDTTAWGITASELEEMLMEKGIYCELTTGNILMLMTGIGNRRSDFERLLEALKEIRAGLEIPETPAEPTAGRLPGRKEIFPIPKKKKRVKLEDAAGLICAGSIIPYPPGIPFVCPGEQITADIIRYIKAMRVNGEKVIGVNDKGEVLVGK